MGPIDLTPQITGVSQWLSKLPGSGTHSLPISLREPLPSISQGLLILALAIIFCILTSPEAEAQVIYTQANIGGSTGGTYTSASGTHTLSGAGSGLGKSSDSFNYAYTPATGNIELISSVQWNSTPPSSYSFAGLTIRSSLDAAAQEATIMVSQGNGVNFSVRQTDGTDSLTTLGPALAAPVAPATTPALFLRLVRSGNQIAGYQSSDRITWSLVGTATFTSLPANFFAGFAISSTTSTAATANFSQVSYLVNVPQRSANMRLWLRSDSGVLTSGGSVTDWLDQSGFGNNANQPTGGSRPGFTSSAVNGQPALDFNGSSQFLTLGGNFKDFTGATIIAVVKPTGVPASPARIIELGDLGSNEIILSQTSSTQGSFYVFSGGSASAIVSNNGFLNNYQILEGVQNGAASATIYTNGTAGGTAGVYNPLSVNRTKSAIGKYPAPGYTYYFQGSIAEILVWNKGLSTSERQAVEAYCYSKYILGTPPALTVPSISPNNAIVTGPTTVTITTPDANATMYYTTDGSVPSPGAAGTSRYLEPFQVTQTKTVNVVSTAPYYKTATASSVITFAPLTSSIPKSGMLLWLRSDIGLHMRNIQTGTVSGSYVNNNRLEFIIANGSLPGGSVTKTKFMGPTDTPSTVASYFVSQINGDTNLQNAGISATVSTNVMTLTSTSTTPTYYFGYDLNFCNFSVACTTNIDRWSDLSGAGRDATNTANFPQLIVAAQAGFPSASFNSASTQFLTLPTTGFDDLSKGLTYIVVAKPTTVVGNMISLGNGGANGAQLVLVNSNWVGLDTFSGTTETSLWYTGGASTTDFQTFEAVHNGNGNASIFTNGTLGNQGSIGNLLNTARTLNYIGRYSAGTNYFNGQILEVFAYNRPLSPGERISIEKYISNRYFNTLIVSPSTGVYTGPQTVAMAAGPSSQIWYTLDGSTPVVGSPSIHYTAPFTVNTSTVVRAVTAAAPTTYVSSNIAIDSTSASVPKDGLLLWLRPGFGQFSSDAPTLWKDLSGSGNDATSNATLDVATNSVNGYPAVTNETAVVPPGTYGYLSLPTGFNSFNGTSIFAVGKPAGTSSGGVWLGLGNGTAAANNPIKLSNSGTSGSFSISNGASINSVSGAPIVLNRFQLFSGTQNGSTSGSIFTNGVLTTTGTLNKPNSVSRTFNNVMADSNSSGAAYTGAMAEVMLYGRTVNSAELANIHAYLLNKYQLGTTAPPAPIISVPTSSPSSPIQVAISAQFGSKIYITTDGSTPTTSSDVYQNPINVYYTQTLKAIAVQNGVTSSVSSATYTLNSTNWPAPNPSDMTPLNIQLQLPTNAI